MAMFRLQVLPHHSAFVHAHAHAVADCTRVKLLVEAEVFENAVEHLHRESVQCGSGRTGSGEGGTAHRVCMRHGVRRESGDR
jgi:hypothetical protein